MKFEPIVPLIWTHHLNETVAFYTEKLGFHLGNYSEEWGWATLHRDACELMVSRPTAQTRFEHPFFTGTFYIKTDDVGAFWDHVKDSVKVAYPMEDFDWGMREFAIYDNNHYILQFGQELE